MIVKGDVVLGHWPDNGNVNVNSSNANFLNVGGNYDDGDNAGLFYANVNANSNNSNSNNGSRNSCIHTPIFYDIWGNLHSRATWQNTTGPNHTLVLLNIQAKEDVFNT